MFLSNPVKIFHAAWFFSIVFAGCGAWRGNDNPPITFASPPQSEYPFSVREPEIFQAGIIIRVGDTERKMFIARNLTSRRIDFDIGTENHRSVVVSDKEYVVDFKRKTFEERELSSNAADAFDPMTAEILSTRDYASFEETGRKNGIVEYRARINESANSEAVIFFDEKIGLPVKQEFYSIEGEERRLQYWMELQNFKPEAEAELFRVPREFRRKGR